MCMVQLRSRHTIYLPYVIYVVPRQQLQCWRSAIDLTTIYPAMHVTESFWSNNVMYNVQAHHHSARHITRHKVDGRSTVPMTTSADQRTSRVEFQTCLALRDYCGRKGWVTVACVCYGCICTRVDVVSVICGGCRQHLNSSINATISPQVQVNYQFLARFTIVRKSRFYCIEIHNQHLAVLLFL